MDDRKLLGIGIVGALVAAVCCVTPVLVALLAAIDLSAAVGWLDYVLLPALAAFVGVIAYAVNVRRSNASASCGPMTDQRQK